MDLTNINFAEIGQLIITLVIDSALLIFGLCLAGIAFFVWLNRRDLKYDKKSYSSDFNPHRDLAKHRHRGKTEDDKIDVKRSLRPYLQAAEALPAAKEGSLAKDSNELHEPQPNKRESDIDI